MPKLTRLRFVSIGHQNARFDDLVLNFQDENETPTDSTIWLRNGGGKSSLLNLFFAGVRPGRREFLGAKEDKKELKEYIKQSDKAVVIYEWQLDGKTNQKTLIDGDSRLLTGAFYEYRNGDFKTLYFTARVSQAVPEVTLEWLPIFVYDNGKPIRRRGMTAFKQEWTALHKRHPNLHISHTSQPKEWRQLLQSAGIDTELFRYQLEMNRREGGADELFRFHSHEQFVDFILKLVLDPSLAETVRTNIEIHRKDLRSSIQVLQPESELIKGWIERLEPMQTIIDERILIADSVGNAKSRLSGLLNHSQQQLSSLRRQVEELNATYDRELQNAEKAEGQQKAKLKQAATFRYHAAIKKLDLAKSQHEQKSQREKELRRSKDIWSAAIPLRNALKFERRAKEHRSSLEKLKSEHKPAYDELCVAATQYYLGLQKSLTKAKNEKTELESELTEIEKQRERDQSELTDCRVQSERIHGVMKAEQALIDRATSEHQRLIEQGVLEPNETGSAATLRITDEQNTLAAVLESKSEELESLKARLRKTEAELAETAQRIAALKNRHAQFTDQLVEAEKLREGLESNQVLLGILQTESIDFLKLSPSFWRVVGDATQQAANQLVELRIARVEDERALNHLEQHGLLPPSRDVQRILRLLDSRVRAWSGWMYISENTSNSSKARDFIQRSPSLAAGVIVHDDDFELAKSIVTDANCALISPIVMARQSVANSTEQPQGIVLGPTGDGLFDKQAATKEHATRQHSLDQSTEQIANAEARQKSINEMTGDIRAFQKRYPVEWFSTLAEKMTTLEGQNADEKSRQSALNQNATSLASSIESTETEKNDFEKKLAAASRFLELVTRFVDEFESKTDSAKLRLSELKKRITEQKEKESSLKQEIEQSKFRSKEIGIKIENKVTDTARWELQSSEIGYADKKSNVALSGVPLSQLADDYRRLKSNYELNVDAGGLIQSAKENEQYAADERTKFNKLLSDGIIEAEVVDCLESIDEPEAADETHQQFVELHAKARSELGNSMRYEIQPLESGVIQAEEHCVKVEAPLELPLHQEGQGVEVLETTASTLESESKVLGSEYEGHFAKAQRAENRKSECESKASSIADLLERFQDLERTREDLLKLAPEVDSAETESIPNEPDELRIELKELQSILQQLNDSNQSLNSHRHKIGKSLRSWSDSPKFESLKSMLVRRLRAFDEFEIERQYVSLQEQLKLRLNTIQDKLDEIGENRGQLVSELHAVANKGLAVLRSAANHSRLPEQVPVLGNLMFMTVNMNLPAERDEQRGRLAALVDEFVQTDQMPSAIEMIQKSVQRLAQPIRIRVLNPDPLHEGQRIDISDLHKFSGGERLTCAVVLYCTLAQLRAKNEGKVKRPTGVLLLDNPIGSASRASFVNLQRDVARAAQIQLVYATGVNDYEALQPLPNLIRLRNDRVNRNNGQHVVELDGDSPFGIQAVHVGRKEEPSTSR